MIAPLGSRIIGVDTPEVSTCKMEDAYLEIVQPTHLRPFIPLAAQELQDRLIRMPRPIACWYASEFRFVIRESKTLVL